MAMPSKAFASTPAQDALVEADKAHYMHGYHMFDEHREQGALNIVAGRARISATPRAIASSMP